MVGHRHFDPFDSMYLSLRSTPHPGFQSQMKVYRDSLLKMVHNPGGDDCIQGGGVVPTYHIFSRSSELWKLHQMTQPAKLWVLLGLSGFKLEETNHI